MLGSAGAQVRAVQAFNQGLLCFGLKPELLLSTAPRLWRVEEKEVFWKTQTEKGMAQSSHDMAWFHS